MEMWWSDEKKKKIPNYSSKVGTSFLGMPRPMG
jgi:hypothetical protein